MFGDTEEFIRVCGWFQWSLSSNLNVEQKTASDGSKEPGLLKHNEEDLGGHGKAADCQVPDGQVVYEYSDAWRGRGRGGLPVTMTSTAATVGQSHDHDHIPDQRQDHQYDDDGDSQRHFRRPGFSMVQSLQLAVNVAVVCVCL